MLIRTVLAIALMSSLVWAEPMHPKAGDVIAYYNKDWQLIKSKETQGFYRQLIKVEANGYWVQDFYVDTGTKQTDAFLITNSKQLQASDIGIPQGTRTIWYASGEKKQAITYHNNNPQQLISWYRNGQTRYKGNLSSQGKEGQWTAWYPNGSKGWQGNFIANKMQGKWNYWYKNGQLKEQGTYIQDKKQAIWVYWSQSGKKIKEEQYKDNEKIAQWSF